MPKIGFDTDIYSNDGTTWYGGDDMLDMGFTITVQSNKLVGQFQASGNGATLDNGDLILPFNILGLTQTINKQTPDDGMAVSDSITTYNGQMSGSVALYVVPAPESDITPKAVSLDNLQTFKGKCDETYAPMSRALPAPAGTTDAGKVPTVNSAGNGYELQTPSGGGGGIVAVDSLPTANAAEYEKHLLYLQSGDLYFLADRMGEPIVTTLEETLPETIIASAAAAIGTNAYIFGGIYENGSSDKIVKFDGISETCTTLSATLSNKNSRGPVVAIGTNAYIFCVNDDTIINKFDSVSETCTTLSATLPNKMNYASAAAFSTNAYIFGGRLKNSGLDEIVKFDSVSETCTTLSATLPQPNINATAAAIGTNAYIFGGDNMGLRYDEIVKFDSVSETCTTLSATLPSIIFLASAAAIGTNAYVFGGNDNQSFTDEIVKFDSVSETCTTLSATLPTPRDYISAATIGTNAYIFGGRSTDIRYNDIVKVSFTEYSYKKITSTEV